MRENLFFFNVEKLIDSIYGLTRVGKIQSRKLENIQLVKEKWRTVKEVMNVVKEIIKRHTSL